MYHFFEYIYIGCYYADILCESTAKKTLRPILKCLLILLYQIPFLKDRLALQGLSPEQAIAKVFRLGDRLDAIDCLGLREAHIGYMLSLLFAVLVSDVILILWHLCGKSFSFIPLSQEYKYYLYFGLPIVGALVLPYCLYWSKDRHIRIIKKYKRMPQKEQTKAFIVYLIVNILTISLFLILLQSWMNEHM